MKKGFLCALLCAATAACAIPAQAAMTIDTSINDNGTSRVVSMIMANMDVVEAPAPDETVRNMQALVDANTLIQTRFPMAQYMLAMNRAGDQEDGVVQTLRLYQDEKTASIAILWQGEQADGTHGSSVQSLALDLETGKEITLDQLFAQPSEAFAAMEAIISEQIEGGLSDYMEHADLLPMPADSFSYDETGLTVYYPQERYLYFSGRSGAVHFAWHEIDELIAQDGPVWALSRPAASDALGVEEQLTARTLPGALAFGVGDRLGDALEAHALLSEPDYTTESLVYQFEDEALRGFALEIPKYAETPETETPISAVRSSRVEMCGLITGETTREQAVSLLGEPEQLRTYDAEAAADMLLVPGESLLYSLGGQVLQLHFDESDVLSTVFIRVSMPERWM